MGPITKEEQISPTLLNRKGRREYKKRTGVWFSGIQDRSRVSHAEYLIPLTRKSRAGVEYTYYKKILDVKNPNRMK